MTAGTDVAGKVKKRRREGRKEEERDEERERERDCSSSDVSVPARAVQAGAARYSLTGAAVAKA